MRFPGFAFHSSMNALSSGVIVSSFSLMVVVSLVLYASNRAFEGGLYLKPVQLGKGNLKGGNSRGRPRGVRHLAFLRITSASHLFSWKWPAVSSFDHLDFTVSKSSSGVATLSLPRHPELL